MTKQHKYRCAVPDYRVNICASEDVERQTRMEDSKITYRPSKHHPSRIRKELNNEMNDTIRKWAKVSSRRFSEEDTPMSNERRNRCPTLLVIRELQIKTTLRHHFMPMRIAMTQKEKRNQAPAETEKSAPSPWLREYKMGQSV